MPARLTRGNPINNYRQPSRVQRSSAQDVIARITYDDIWRGAGTLFDDRIMRVDMQGDIAGPPIIKNLQVQIDGLQGHSTVAHANVSTSLQTADPANQRGVAKKVISALNQSLDSGCSYTVDGSIP